MTEKLKVFTKAYVEKLQKDLESGDSLMDYLNIETNFPEEMTITSKVDVPDTIPNLNAEADNDAESAIAVYEYLGNLDNTQASDPRFWAYLSHVTFREYCMNRYKLDEDMNKKQYIDSVIQHWFVSENDRKLRRHTIARLWWATNLTISPWERDAEEFEHLKNDDPYIYTRILLSNQDIFQSILERSIGRSSKILIAFLEYLNQNPDFKVRSSYRDLIKEINVISGFKKLQCYPLQKFIKLLKRQLLPLIKQKLLLHKMKINRVQTESNSFHLVGFIHFIFL